MTLVNKTYCIDIRKNIDLDLLKPTWLNLEAKNDELSFFHSWEWLETWFHTFKPEALLVSAKYEGEIVALGLFGKSQEVRHHLIKSNQIRLFQTGNPQEDQIWVEFNDFLCHPDHRIEMLESRAKNLLEHFNNTSIILSTPEFKTNLQQLASDGRHYIDSLSRNTRYQINRSIKRYKNLYGAVKLSFANDIDQALQYWDTAGELHLNKWQDSGFKNPKFAEFHQEFMRKNFNYGCIDVAKITAGSHLVAIIYNIIYKQNVYFYLQGIQPETDSKLKPGLTAHTMLIEHYLEQGMCSYDFMGGYNQYKKQLSQTDEDLLTIKIQKPLLKFQIENIARSIKQRALASQKTPR
jgi:CelD/BcsL family acetyltransferase involved in cellulose biosynthesis